MGQETSKYRKIMRTLQTGENAGKKLRYATIRHLYSRHLLQDISQALVVGIGKACHIVGDGIASLSDTWSLHHNILQLCSLLRQEHMINSTCPMIVVVSSSWVELRRFISLSNELSTR